MTYIEIAGLLGLAAALVVLRWKVLLPAILILRDVLRNDPSARKAFVGQGSWVDFSRRFGARYVFAAFAAAFVWILVAANVIPDTEIGAWLVFGPALACIALGGALGALCAVRWLAGDR